MDSIRKDKINYYYNDKLDAYIRDDDALLSNIYFILLEKDKKIAELLKYKEENDILNNKVKILLSTNEKVLESGEE